MSNRKSKRRYFFHYILILCCLTFFLSACEDITISVSGEITCDEYTSGQIHISLLKVGEKGLEFIAGATIDNLNEKSDYKTIIPIEYLNTKVVVSAIWDCDDNYPGIIFSKGDYWGQYGGNFYSFQLELINNNIDVDINNKITATISGEVTCDVYSSGPIYISVWDSENMGSLEHLVNMTGGSISEPGPYTTLISNVEPGNPVWVIGLWDKDGSGNSPTSGDYSGVPENTIILEEETTGVDFDLDTVWE